jgi:hypothetical protein
MSQMTDLNKAMEGGQYNVAPNALLQGGALQVEDLSPVMQNVCIDDKKIKIQKDIKLEACKSTLAQFDRQLSYGEFGGSATIEGASGQEENLDVARIVVPMCYYTHTRRVTMVADLVATVDGKKASDRAAEAAAMKLAGDIEFHCFYGSANFSNAGVFDGSPGALPSVMPELRGLDIQVRGSDNERNAQDLMFNEYGSSETVVLVGGGTLTQDNVEDVSVRSALNFGEADVLHVDPRVLSAYNKITFGKERIILAGSPQEATGGMLRKQWVSGGTVSVEASQFLRAKVQPAQARQTGPAAPAVSTATYSGTSSSLAPGVYQYYTTAVNEIGESLASPLFATAAVTAGQQVNLSIPAVTNARWYNVYRGAAGGSAVQGTAQQYIGRVKAAASGATTFVDLGNRLPGFVTGMLVQKDTLGLMELQPYSRKKLADVDLSSLEAHFRFLSFAAFQPRKNVLLDNLLGAYL